MKTTATPVVSGNARFTVYRPGCVRLEYAWNGAFASGPSVLAGRRAEAKPIRAEVVRRGRTLTIRTARFELTYTDDGKVFSADNLRIAHRDAQDRPAVWTPGQRDAGNLGEVTRSLDQWKWCGGPRRYPVEGILSTDGGHCVVDEPRVYWNAEHDWPECRGHAVAFDGTFFAYGRDYASALSDFVRVFGRIPMIPRWALGFWYSRWYAYRDREVLALAKRYRREGIPLDVMVIDTDWRHGWGGYDWNPKCFPRPRAALKALRNLGLRVALNDHPGYDNYDGLPAADSHLPAVARRLGPLPHQGQWACDWSNREAVRAWKDILLGPLFGDGMDFWWVDGWLKPPFVNLDSQLWANEQYYELAEEKRGRRGLILSRWGGVGSHRYPVQFSGDTPSEWAMLAQQIEFTVRSAGLGAAYWSHDIGGFFGREVDEELFIRWAQFGAMGPIFRTHSDHGVREPWKVGPRARRLFRKQARIRAALAPYLYTLVREAHDAGLPPARPLFLRYNDNDGGALREVREYTLGDELLVIPADGPADPKTGRYVRRAYFPNGVWHEIETGETVAGMRDADLAIPLDRIPTYARRGAIVPAQPVGPTVGARASPELHLHIFPDPTAPSRFTLYEDDGDSLDYRQGRGAWTDIRAFARGRTLTVRIGASRGSYAGQPRRRRWVALVRMEPGDGIAAAEIRTGAGPWRAARAVETRRILAGELLSGHRFARVAADAGRAAVEIRLHWKAAGA